MDTQTIYINGRFLTQRITGVQRFATNLLEALDSELNNYQKRSAKFILLTPASTTTEIKLQHITKKKVGRLSGHLWEQIELPLYARNGLLINFCNIGPAFKRNQFVTICDAAVFRYPKAYGKIFVLWYRLLGFLNARFARRIITISTFSKNELIHFLKLRADKISILYPGVKFSVSEQQDSILEKLQVRRKGYFLAVGSLDLKKNFAGIINAFIQLELGDVELVIVGAEHARVFSNQTIPKRKDIKWTGYVDDAALISLYRNAIAFIYPSFYEGFGIPPLEAMTLECPVIVSQAASLPEVCGDAALYCDPHQISSIRQAMETIIKNPELRKSLQLKGKHHASQFTYEDSAKKLLDLLKI